MRVFQRAVATVVAGLAFATAGVVAAAPASASPEDGKGCVGSPQLPATYVCVISVTPENVVPSVSTTNVPVTVPSVCYFLDCTEPTTVDVPVPNVTPRSGVVAVLWYQGVYYPIAVGQVDAMQLLADTINFANGVVNTVVGTVVPLAQYAIDQAGYYAGVVGQEADEAYARVQEIVNGLPTVDEIVTALLEYVEREIMPIMRQVVYEVREFLENFDPNEIIDPIVQQVLDRINRLIASVQECLRACFVTDLPPVTTT